MASHYRTRVPEAKPLSVVESTMRETLTATPPVTAVATARTIRSRIAAFGAFWYDFVIGDDWQIAAGVALTLIVTFLLSLTSTGAWIAVPIGVLILIPYGVRRALR
jgi:hypothetical protein